MIVSTRARAFPPGTEVKDLIFDLAACEDPTPAIAVALSPFSRGPKWSALSRLLVWTLVLCWAARFDCVLPVGGTAEDQANGRRILAEVLRHAKIRAGDTFDGQPIGPALEAMWTRACTENGPANGPTPECETRARGSRPFLGQSRGECPPGRNLG